MANLFEGGEPQVQRVIRDIYTYLQTVPPEGERVKPQLVSMFHWLIKAIVIAIFSELATNCTPQVLQGGSPTVPPPGPIPGDPQPPDAIPVPLFPGNP